MTTRRRSRGYTIVELMMAITILAIGVSGIVAMEKVTVASNQHAKDLALATHVAQTWAEALATDAANWNHPSQGHANADISYTTYLNQVVGTQGVWFRPSYLPSPVDFGPSFDALGNIVSDSDVANARFCTHVRLTWLYPDTAGNGLIRAEIRVFWLREDAGGGVNNKSVCDPLTDPTAVGAAPEQYHFVYATTAIKETGI